MASYSHSKISAFENCPYQYKLKYIDKVEVDVPETIEMFMGKRVHETLEKLYKDKQFQKDVSKAELVKFYNKIWEKEFSDDILIVKEGLTSENYRKMGEKFISNYYEKYKPFDQLTILGLETQNRMTLPDGNQWHVQIDKLACDKNGNYFVCDYKTNKDMKTQDNADEDRQLAMYSIWVKDKFSDVKSVKLLWHMLAFDKEVISQRSKEQLKKLQEDVMVTIKEIEKATKENNFPRTQNNLCDYCLYKSVCPSHKHLAEIEELPKKEFKEDDGVKFVDEFSEVRNKLRELENKEEELKKNLIEFAKQKGVDVVYGSNTEASIKEFDKVVLPEDKEEFLMLLKEKGIYDTCSMICHARISQKFLKGELHSDISEKIKTEKDWKISLRRRKGDE